MVEAIATEEGAQPFLATALMEGGKQVPLALNTSTTAGKRRGPSKCACRLVVPDSDWL